MQGFHWIDLFTKQSIKLISAQAEYKDFPYVSLTEDGINAALMSSLK